MATRFLAIVSKSQQPQREPDNALAQRCQLTHIHRRAGLSLFVSGIEDAISVPEMGAFVGHLFTGLPSARRVKAFDPVTQQRLMATGGKSAFSDVWGGYVGFLRDTPLGPTVIIRDPSGALPCYYIETDDDVIFCSDVETLSLSGYLRPSVDWTYLREHLLAYDLRTPRTGLLGVTELLAGCRLTISERGSKAECLWSPWDFISSDEKRTSKDIAEHLRETVEGCIRAWAEPFKHILLGVSGGLDSSIIAASLQKAGARFSCYTMATEDPEGDERAYARILCQSLGIPLLERFHNLNHVDVGRSTAAHLPRPLLLAFSQSDARVRADIVRSTGADAFFTGTGGDNVFGNVPTAMPVLDRMQMEGLGPNVLTTLYDVCDLTGCSVWQAADKIIRRLASGQYNTGWNTNDRFLIPSANADRVSVAPHHWLQVPKGVPHGKVAHVTLLARIQGTTDGYSRFGPPPTIHPLLSQPIVEACLAIPSWKWCEGGHNRSMARQAFAHRLPHEIIYRRSKGGPTGFLNRVVETQKAEILTQLHGGLLVKHLDVDWAEITRVLTSDTPISDVDLERSGTFAEVEAWARHWTSLQATAKPGRSTLAESINLV